jgi:cellulose biosynthesis protein BcsQ
MKLKLILLDSDKTYLSKLVSAFSAMPENNMETYSFTELPPALTAVNEIHAEILIAGDDFKIEKENIPEGCSFAYFVNAASLREVRGQKAICRYQRADLIYKEILSLYSDSRLPDAGIGIKGTDSPSREPIVYSFYSCGGGTGGSSAAAACALRFAGAGKRALYLNLERFGSAEAFFGAEGRINLGDILYAVKSKRTNLELKLQSAVKQDECGVFFLDSCRVAPEVMEITPENILQLLSEIKALGQYDYVIVDTDILLDGLSLAVMRNSDAIVLVSDGSEISLIKLGRIRKAMEIISARDEFEFPKAYLLYNKFSSKTSRSADDQELLLLGGAPRFEGASAGKVIRGLAEMPFFDKLL